MNPFKTADLDPLQTPVDAVSLETEFLLQVIEIQRQQLNHLVIALQTILPTSSSMVAQLIAVDPVRQVDLASLRNQSILEGRGPLAVEYRRDKMLEEGADLTEINRHIFSQIPRQNKVTWTAYRQEFKRRFGVMDFHASVSYYETTPQYILDIPSDVVYTQSDGLLSHVKVKDRGRNEYENLEFYLGDDTFEAVLSMRGSTEIGRLYVPMEKVDIVSVSDLYLPMEEKIIPAITAWFEANFPLGADMAYEEFQALVFAKLKVFLDDVWPESFSSKIPVSDYYSSFPDKNARLFVDKKQDFLVQFFYGHFAMRVTGGLDPDTWKMELVFDSTRAASYGIRADLDWSTLSIRTKNTLRDKFVTLVDEILEQGLKPT